MRVACDNREAAHLAADYLERPGHPQPNTALDESKRPASGAPPQWHATAPALSGLDGLRCPQVALRARRWNRKSSLSSRACEPMRPIRRRARSLEGYRHADAPWPARSFRLRRY